MAPALLDPPTKLMTVVEYAALPDDGRRTELVRGEVVEMPQPKFRHGAVCGNVCGELRDYVRSRKLGRVLTNDTGVITERDPDTMRGMDVAFYSYELVPAGDLPDEYMPSPELVVEVRSPGDRRGAVNRKVKEYLSAGVKVVCIVRPERQTLEVHPASGKPRILGIEEEWTLPELFPDFSTPVRNLFE